MILDNLEKTNLKLWHFAEEILTAFPNIYPEYEKGQHFVDPDSNRGIFCTRSAAFRHQTMASFESNGYDKWSKYFGGATKYPMIIFDFSDSIPIWYNLEDRDNPFEYHEFPKITPQQRANLTPKEKQKISFFKTIHLDAIATHYNGGRKFLSAKGGRAGKGKKKPNKKNSNTSRMTKCLMEIISKNGVDKREVTTLEAYKIGTKFGYVGQYVAFAKNLRRNGSWTNNSKSFSATRIVDVSNSLNPGSPNTLNITIIKEKENLEEIKENLKEKPIFKLLGEPSSNDNYTSLFPENFKECKSSRRQLKKSDKEYLESEPIPESEWYTVWLKSVEEQAITNEEKKHKLYGDWLKFCEKQRYDPKAVWTFRDYIEI
jgi:hypothetical protein